jgi:predicted chitinase
VLPISVSISTQGIIGKIEIEVNGSKWFAAPLGGVNYSGATFTTSSILLRIDDVPNNEKSFSLKVVAYDSSSEKVVDVKTKIIHWRKNNGKKDSFWIGNQTCYCNRELTVTEVTKIIKDLRTGTFVTLGNKQYPITILPEYKGNEIFHQNHKTGKYKHELMINPTIENFTEQLNIIFDKYEINTCIRKIHFLSQIYVETQNFSRSVEGDNAYTDTYDPYRGRGFLHLTKSDNYTNYKVDTTIDVISNYSLPATNMATAADVSGWYWKTRIQGGLNRIADTATVERFTPYINAASLNLKDRKAAFEILKKIFQYEKCISKK